MRIPSIPGFDQQAFEKYFKNTGMLMMAKVGSMVIKMIVNTFVLSSYLGAVQNGILNYPMAIVVFFMAVAALGLDGFVTRELVNYPEKQNSLLGTAFWMRLAAGIATLPLVYLTYQILAHFKHQDTPVNYVLIVALTSVVQAFTIIESYFQAKVQAKYVMYVQVAGNLVSAAIKLILVLLHMPLIWFVCALLFDTIILAVGYILAYYHNKLSLTGWKFDKPLALYMLKNAWPLAFSAVLVSIYMKIDQAMIAGYLSSAQLGIYSTVVSLSESFYFLPVAIVTSVFPAIIYARKTDIDRYYKRLQNMYDLMVGISLSIAVFMTFASKYIYQIAFHKHPEFWSGAPVLAVHVWAGIFVFLGSASGQYLIAEGYFKLSMLRTGVGALVNIVLNIYWIPAYGIIGAAYATLVAYAVATFFILIIPKTRGQGVQMLKSLFLISLFQKAFNR
jgi:O-antigen/teichoic acid export membrane protein